ncbi:hypothetical protein [Catenulispora yoronensis]
MSGPKRSSRSRAAGAVVAERRAKAVRMKVSGARLEDIAAALGYNSVNHVSVDIKRALAANLREQSAATEEYIAIEMLRLDELLFAVWEEAMAGSPRHVELGVRIVEARRRLFPTQQVVALTTVESEILRLESELAARRPVTGEIEAE